MNAAETALATWRLTAGQFWTIAGGFWHGRETRRVALLTVPALVALAVMEIALLLHFNTWNRDLFDALERRDSYGVLIQGGVLLLIVAGFCVASAGQLLARRRLA